MSSSNHPSLHRHQVYIWRKTWSNASARSAEQAGFNRGIDPALWRSRGNYHPACCPSASEAPTAGHAQRGVVESAFSPRVMIHFLEFLLYCMQLVLVALCSGSDASLHQPATSHHQPHPALHMHIPLVKRVLNETTPTVVWAVLANGAPTSFQASFVRNLSQSRAHGPSPIQVHVILRRYQFRPKV